MPSWDAKLVALRKQWQDAAERCVESHDELKRYVVEVSGDPNVNMDQLSEITEWSVSYLRALRTKSPTAVPRTRRPAAAAEIPDRTVARIDKLKRNLSKAEDKRTTCKSALVAEIRKVTEPAPSLKDVADVLGLSHQRISQLLSE